MSDIPRLLSWFEAGELVRPADDAASLVDLAHAITTVCGAGDDLDGQARHIADLIGEPEHLILVLVDGFGMNLVEREPADSPFRERLAMQLKSVYPSSTAPALTSLATAGWPAEHAVPGWWTYLPDAAATATILPYNERFSQDPLETTLDPALAFPLPSRQARFTRQRLAVSPRQISGSIYSVYSQADAEAFGYQSLESAVDRIVQFVGGAGGPTYTYLYIPYVDAEEHRHGNGHTSVALAAARVRARIAALERAVKDQARIVITADHGLIDVGAACKHILDRSDPLCAMLRIPPSCEPRAPAFHVRAGQHERFAAAFGERFGERFALLTIDEADAMRLFGKSPMTGETRRRLGDFVAVARTRDAIVYEPSTELRAMRGFHGGLTADEMMVPLVVV